MNNKIELLKNINILSLLTDHELNIFSGQCEENEFRKDSIIFKSGDTSESFYIVSAGEVRIIKRKGMDEENIMAYFLPGEIFGELEMFESEQRSATAIANKNTRLFVFPKHGLNPDDLYRNYPDIFVKICHKLITINAGRIRQTNKLISEKNTWIEELKNQMLADKLTGFYNRTYLEDELPNIFKQYKNDRITIAAVKPDNFKSVNDNFGHEAGDIALKTISDKVRSVLRESEVPVRYRGNEFIVIYFNSGTEEALEKAGELHSALSAIDIGRLIADKSLYLTYSIGISNFPEHTENADNLIDLAYAKLFEKRDTGGNGILTSDKNEESILTFFKSVRAFSSLHPSEIKEVSAYLKSSAIKKDGILCREGDEGNELYIIQSGKVGVRIKLGDGSEKEITEFSAGDFFGEMSIFENEKRSATCIAKEDSRIFKLYKNDFFAVMKKKPVIALKIMRQVLDITSSRISNTSRFISEMVKWGEEASRRAVTDQLTGVYNRRYLDGSLEDLFNKSKQEKKHLSLIMADMDYFREVNEGYSHEIGDKYIFEVASIFKKCLRVTDIIARFGGDEFTIVLPETAIEKAMELAEEIRLEVEKLDFLKNYTGPQLNLSISMGLAVYPEHSKDLNKLKELADKALYKAKNSGRNRVSFPE